MYITVIYIYTSFSHTHKRIYKMQIMTINLINQLLFGLACKIITKSIHQHK